MKTLFAVLFMFITFLCMNNSAMAQEAQGNVFVMTNFERAFPDEVSGNELDSLATLYLDKVYGADNEYTVSCKAVRHWWGHNHRDFIVIIEVKSWDDVTKANQRGNELFEKAWSTKEARDNFNKEYSKYFTGKHSDEIYREVVFGK